MGGLRTALYNWLFARQNGGAFILRIEDTDQSRKVEGAEEQLLAALTWAGLHVDEGPHSGGDAGPYRQSERLDIYKHHALQLVAGGHAYACFCTADRLEQLRERQQKMGLATRYDGLCRKLQPDEAAHRSEAEPHVIRLAVPEDGIIIFEDRVRKKVRFEWKTVDDQVLIKSDGFPTYHLANVVDDHLMGITHVIRGEEWLPSMPKHLLLYQGFGWEPPEFAHLPLLLNADKSKLSKRQGHVAVDDFRQEGYLPEALVNFVALLGWNDQSNQEAYDLAGLTSAFSIDRVQKGGAVFDTEKLRWLNGQHIRRMDVAAFKGSLIKHLDVVAAFNDSLIKSQDVVAAFKDSLIKHQDNDWNVTDAMLAAVQSKINLLSDAREQLEFFFEEPVVYDEAARQALANAQSRGILAALLAKLPAAETFTGDALLEVVKQIGADLGLKGRDLWHPIRAAIAGRVIGPDMVTIVEAFGYEKCRQRITTAMELS